MWLKDASAIVSDRLLVARLGLGLNDAEVVALLAERLAVTVIEVVIVAPVCERLAVHVDMLIDRVQLLVSLDVMVVSDRLTEDDSDPLAVIDTVRLGVPLAVKLRVSLLMLRLVVTLTE